MVKAKFFAADIRKHPATKLMPVVMIIGFLVGLGEPGSPDLSDGLDGLMIASLLWIPLLISVWRNAK